MAITLFSFGYWGWGNATAQLVKAIDVAEEERGFRPPIFVDIRLRRQGRAKGFVGDAFAELLGAARYRWMKDLGNEAIASGDAGIKIRRPEAAADLLALAVQAARDQRRVIFFCACDYPRHGGEQYCHRDEVTRLILAQARTQNRSLSVVEWPGGEPAEARLRVEPKLFSTVKLGRKSIPFDGARLSDFAGLPWGSVLRLESGVETCFVAVGPPKFDAQGYWYLPVIQPPKAGADKDSAFSSARKWRRECGLDERRSGWQ
jgi:hypothetical protein